MTTAPVTIRPARPDDAPALARLAALDSAPAPTGEVLVAESDGELRAALPVGGGRAVADPFHPTAELVALLEVRARPRTVVPAFGGRHRFALPRLA